MLQNCFSLYGQSFCEKESGVNHLCFATFLGPIWQNQAVLKSSEFHKSFCGKDLQEFPGRKIAGFCHRKTCWRVGVSKIRVRVAPFQEDLCLS